MFASGISVGRENVFGKYALYINENRTSCYTSVDSIVTVIFVFLKLNELNAQSS